MIINLWGSTVMKGYVTLIIFSIFTIYFSLGVLFPSLDITISHFVFFAIVSIVFLLFFSILYENASYKKKSVYGFIFNLYVSLLTFVPIAFFVSGGIIAKFIDPTDLMISILVLDIVAVYFYTSGELQTIKSQVEVHKKSAIKSISLLLNKEIIKRVPRTSMLDSRIDIVNKYYIENIDESSLCWYTNEEFAIKARQLIDTLDVMKEEIRKELEIVKNITEKHYYLAYEDQKQSNNYNSSISQCKSILKGQAGEDKVNEILKSLGITYYSSFNFLDDSANESVEIDFLTVLDGIIYVIEVKDYSADKIVLKNTGQFIKENNKNSYTLDTLNQISRHNHFLRNVYGPLDIINFIVLTDKNTLVEDEFKNKNIQVLYIDGLRFKLNKSQSEADKHLLSLINKNRTKPKLFPFFDIDKALIEVNRINNENMKNYYYQIEELVTSEQIRKFNEEMKDIIAKELENNSQIQKNGLANDIIEELSVEAISKYKALLNVV